MIQEKLKSASAASSDDPLSARRLSAREREVAGLLIAGYLYKEVSAQLKVGLPTVRTYVQRVYRKLGIHSRKDLIRVAAKEREERSHGDDAA